MGVAVPEIGSSSWSLDATAPPGDSTFFRHKNSNTGAKSDSVTIAIFITLKRKLARLPVGGLETTY